MDAALDEVSRRDKLGLIAEWMDPQASLLRRFYFFFYPYDSTIELYDIKKNRLFLKRTKVENLNFKDIYVGNQITIFSRQLKLVDYANVITKRLLGIKMMKTFALIKPDGFDHKTEILETLLSNGFTIINLRMLKFTDELAAMLLVNERNSSKYLDLKKHLQNGPCVAIEMVGDNAVDKLKEIAGDIDPVVAREKNPSSIIALLGLDEVHNTIYYAPTAEIASKNAKVMFEIEENLGNPDFHTVILEDSTCCVIKPHAIKEGKLAAIMREIEKTDFKITAMQMFRLNTALTEEFYEIYKGILAEYNDMVQELTSGACVAMEIVGPYGKETPLQFRAFVGPSDPDIARKLRPETLRAQFGVDRVHNAIHASDLPSDGVLEVEYFFKVIL